METKRALQGGEFIVRETLAEEVFIPEQYDEDQRMIAQTTRDFVRREVIPHVDQLDKHDNALLRQMMEKAGELGLLGVSVPEEYDGFGSKFVTSMLVAEEVSRGFSFSVAFSAHTGIATLPIVYYGNEEQKSKYLPKLATGQWVGAYCLTEPGSGSDANSGKTKAVLSPDGKHYLINGQKMWITNGGIADLFIVFAKIDDDKDLTAFIVEKTFGGITLGAEEEKMGIKGSSTRQIFFEDCPVPVENMLSERQNGFKIAVNILNIGRIKLGSAVLGAGKGVVDQTVTYANDRKQFGKSIGEFGAIQHKMAEQVIRIFATESAVYRAGQNIEDAIEDLISNGMDKSQASLEGIRQYAIECAMMKVYGSETLDFVVDEGVQVYGGMGYSAESKVEKAYRDSRINRIFEGTNEINRLLTVDMVLKRAMKGELDLMGPAMTVAEELLAIPDFGGEDADYFAEKKKYIRNFKKAILLAAGAAVKKFMAKLSDQQEVIMNIADMAIETYVAESVLLRVEKLEQMRGAEANALYRDIADVLIYDSADRIHKAGRDAVNAFAEGDEHMGMTMGMKRFTKVGPVNVVAARRRIAAKLLADNRYDF